MIDPVDSELSIRRQCELIGLTRSTWYYEPARESELNLTLMRLIDDIYMEMPEFGYRRITEVLQRAGYQVNRKRIARLMRKMGLQALFPRKNTSKRHPNHKIWPYLLRDRVIQYPDEVWCIDITYVPLVGGFMYLVAIMDWFSRFVLSWELSNSMETGFCLMALEQAFSNGRPLIFNSDQGSQFTSAAFTDQLLTHNIRISIDGRGRCFDNIFIERLWRSVKYEDIYIYQYPTVGELITGLTKYFHKYNYLRPHQNLAYCTPAEVYLGCKMLDRPLC